MFGGSSGNAIAYYKNGTMKWMVSLGLWVISNPAISPQDIVYFGSESGSMYAFKEDGTQAWNFGSKCSIYSNAEVAPSGNLYFGEYCGHDVADGGYFTAITSTGACHPRFLSCKVVTILQAPSSGKSLPRLQCGAALLLTPLN